MRITIVGCASFLPEPNRRQSSLAVKAGDMLFLIDAGDGTAGGLVSCGVQRRDLDAALLTHFHPDHTAGLVPLLLAMRVRDKRQRPFYIMGSQGLNKFMLGLSDAFGDWINAPDSPFKPIQIKPPSSKTWTGDPLLTCKSTSHSEFSIGWRIESESKALVVTGDTELCGSLIDLAANADVLICDSTAPDEKPLPGHLTPRLAGELATKANVKILVLTHLDPETRAADPIGRAQQVFSGNVILAEDGMTLEI